MHRQHRIILRHWVMATDRGGEGRALLDLCISSIVNGIAAPAAASRVRWVVVAGRDRQAAQEYPQKQLVASNGLKHYRKYRLFFCALFIERQYQWHGHTCRFLALTLLGAAADGRSFENTGGTGKPSDNVSWHLERLLVFMHQRHRQWHGRTCRCLPSTVGSLKERQEQARFSCQHHQ